MLQRPSEFTRIYSIRLWNKCWRSVGQATYKGEDEDSGVGVVQEVVLAALLKVVGCVGEMGELVGDERQAGQRLEEEQPGHAHLPELALELGQAVQPEGAQGPEGEAGQPDEDAGLEAGVQRYVSRVGGGRVGELDEPGRVGGAVADVAVVGLEHCGWLSQLVVCGISCEPCECV